jgi:hypothetical protein
MLGLGRSRRGKASIYWVSLCEIDRSLETKNSILNTPHKPKEEECRAFNPLKNVILLKTYIYDLFTRRTTIKFISRY